MTARQRGWLLPPLAVFFAAGILLGRIASSWVYGAAGSVLALAACLLLRGRGRFCALLALGLALGCLRGALAFHPALPAEGSYAVSGIVSAEVESRAERQIRTSLSQVTLDGVPLRGGAYWSFYAEEIPEGLVPGMRVTFLGSLYHPSGPSNPDGYDFREELLRRGITVGLYGQEDLAVSLPASFSLSGSAAALRHRLSRALLSSPLGEEAGAYAAAMLLGNRSFLPREDRTAFSRLGIAHLLSVSGFHTGIIIAFLALLFRRLRLPQKCRLPVYALVLGGYVLLCGSAQPVLRASLLLLLYQRGRMLARPRSMLHLLSAAWLLMLTLSPVQLTGLSFQLSFAAMAGLTLLSSFFSSLWQPEGKWGRRLRDSFSAGLAAQIGILLPELKAFQELPLLALLLNIPLMAYSSLLIALYWAALLSLPLPFLSDGICFLARWATQGLLALVRLLGSLPGITLWTKAPTLLSAAGVLLLAAGCCGMLRLRPRSRGWLSAVGCLVLALSLIPLPHRGTEYIQFSVGDADAALLWDGDMVLAVDTGYEDGVLSDFLHRRRLAPDAVILTHLHADHAGGLLALREDHIPIPLVYLPDDATLPEVHPDVLALLETLQREGTEFRSLAAGDRLELPSGSVSVLWPEEGKTRPGQDANESSLVLFFDLKGTTLLQAGDLDGRYEMYAAAPADVLKAAHHGSTRSSSEAYLEAVSPLAVLLSTGNRDRTAQFRERLEEGCVLFSTQDQGMLRVRFLENAFEIETFR
ncbi:MAG: ComEC/Rec2 family competence protein [Clostridia bacterium]|nr:ComEC/Rec2 family competence protein [Clostridia bacterium]